MSKRDGSRRRVLSQDERVLWSTVTRSIAPLRDGALDADIEAEAAVTKKPRPAARKAKPAAVPAPAKSAPPGPPQLTPLSRRMRRSVARGKDAIDGKLDLHGLTQS